jgi:hypothetical protein
LSLWHTDSDAFEHGQWVKSRIYERRSDLSADGSLLVSFARRSGGPFSANHPSASRDTWIAVSRPPWFTALALWFVGGTYCTGAFFSADRALWLPFDPGPLPYVDRTDNWTERMVHHNRLLRDGWTGLEGARLETWARADPTGARTLLMTAHTDRDFGAHGGPHVAEYAVRIEARTR